MRKVSVTKERLYIPAEKDRKTIKNQERSDRTAKKHRETETEM
jgi:hypothetical protein